MTKLQFKGNWNEAKGKLKQKYGQLSGNDLAFAEGKDDELLQQELGKSKEDLRKKSRTSGSVDSGADHLFCINTLL